MTPQEQYLKETGANTIWKIPNHTHTDEYVEWMKNYVKTSDSLAPYVEALPCLLWHLKNNSIN